MCPWLPAHESENVRQVYPNKSQNLPQNNVKIQNSKGRGRRGRGVWRKRAGKEGGRGD